MNFPQHMMSHKRLNKYGKGSSWLSEKHTIFTRVCKLFMSIVGGRDSSSSQRCCDQALCVSMHVVYLFVCVCKSVWPCQECFLFNHPREISNLALKLNMKGNLLYFYSLSLHKEPGNYLIFFFSPSQISRMNGKEREREWREKSDGEKREFVWQEEGEWQQDRSELKLENEVQ